MIPFIIGGLAAAVGFAAGAFTSHAAGEGDRKKAKHYESINNDLIKKRDDLEKRYIKLEDKSNETVSELERKLLESEIEKDSLYLVVRLQNSLLLLQQAIDRDPSFEVLLNFQQAVIQTNLVLHELGEDTIQLPKDYFSRNLIRAKIKLESQHSSFSFEVVTVNPRGQIIDRKQASAPYQTIDLGQGVTLDMVLIPGETFMMGSPNCETERSDDEGPQHQVTLAKFWMGKYPITQAQWRAVAAMPQVKIDLDPNPSYFKGDNRPVERVSWNDAVEFCDRLSQKLGQPYTLPSEAQWEYACRAGTTTPFHFSDTISPDLANYDGNYTYGSGPKGTYRKKTTEVNSFPPNGFGLYGMHGNVWEWCLDHFHDSCNGAPADGSAWVTGGDSRLRMLRGGSWNSDPRRCRCAYRDYYNPVNRYNISGFRVMNVPPRTWG